MSEESTTPDLVELTPRAIEAVNRGDLDAVLGLYAPDSVYDLSRMGIGTFEGLVAIRGFYEDWLGGYEEYEIEPEEILDLGNGVVFAITRQTGTPAGSTDGARVREVWVYSAVFTEGKLVRVVAYGSDIDEGRAATERLAKGEGMMSEESTTPDLVELQNRLTEAANRRDLDALMAFYAPDGVYDMSPIGMGVFEGQAVARGFLEGWWGSYEEHEFEAEETLDLGNGVGFRVLILKGRPVGSSGEVQLLYAAVGVWEDGKIVRMTNYNDIDEARAAAERLAQERG